MHQFYYEQYEGIINGEVIRSQIGNLHYGEAPRIGTDTRTMKTFEELKEHVVLGYDPFCHFYKTITGKKIIRIDTSYKYIYIKPKTKFSYASRKYALVVDKNRVTAKDLQELSVDEYALWCKDNGLTCKFERVMDE